MFLKSLMMFWGCEARCHKLCHTFVTVCDRFVTNVWLKSILEALLRQSMDMMFQECFWWIGEVPVLIFAMFWALKDGVTNIVTCLWQIYEHEYWRLGFIKVMFEVFGRLVDIWYQYRYDVVVRQFRGFPQVGTPYVTKRQKKTLTIEKSCLECFWSSRNLLNVEHAPQLLTHNNRLVIQLHLSSEIDRFEDKQPQILTKTNDNPWVCT